MHRARLSTAPRPVSQPRAEQIYMSSITPTFYFPFFTLLWERRCEMETSVFGRLAVMCLPGDAGFVDHQSSKDLLS